MEKKMKVLFLTAWYPHRYDAMEGLFVRKHAEAVSRYADVYVLFVKEDLHIKKIEVVEQYFNQVKEVYIYYPRLSSTFIRLLYYFKVVLRGLCLIFNQWGKPDVTHANIFVKSAIIGYYLKLRYHIPYVVTEHWTGYLPANGSYARTSRFHQLFVRYVALRASCVMPVSESLAQAMQNNGIKANYFVVNNVVDDFFYKKLVVHQPHDKIRIVHVSCFMEEAKNTFGILRALKQVSSQRSDFEVVFVGTGVDFNHTVAYAESLSFPVGMLRFVGEQTPENVCMWLYSSDFMLMFSNYENAPVVLSESMATGTPIISSAVGGIPEMVSQKEGKLVSVKDEAALRDAIIWMLDHFQEYDPEIIRESARKFTYDEVGKQLLQVYKAAVR